MKMGNLYTLNAAESKYGNQIAPPPNIVQRDAFSVKSSTQPHSVTQAGLNDIVQNLNLPKTKAWLLGSQLQQWNLLIKGVKETLFSRR
jgi:hypothetical protein